MRILVPLDGTDFAASILPDAQRLAGPNGELVLVQDASILGTRWVTDVATIYERNRALASATGYLEGVAQGLREQGVAVQVRAVAMGDPAFAIDAAARIFDADMIACATHGRGMLGRLLWGSVARRVLVESPVPVLLRHAEDCAGAVVPPAPEKRRILVPLDGSAQSEHALPLAEQLARQWNAEIRLVHVIPDVWAGPTDRLGGSEGSGSDEAVGPGAETLAYLRRMAGGLKGPVEVSVLAGPVVDRLVAAVGQWSISEVVMTSHGRMGLARVILGSVADALIERLHCPIMVVPPLALEAAEPTQREDTTTAPI
jgi:nucleotide-binding universal stress UspA family protein